MELSGCHVSATAGEPLRTDRLSIQPPQKRTAEVINIPYPRTMEGFLTLNRKFTQRWNWINAERFQITFSWHDGKLVCFLCASPSFSLCSSAAPSFLRLSSALAWVISGPRSHRGCTCSALEHFSCSGLGLSLSVSPLQIPLTALP